MNEDSFGSHDRYYSTITSNFSKIHFIKWIILNNIFFTL